MSTTKKLASAGLAAALGAGAAVGLSSSAEAVSNTTTANVHGETFNDVGHVWYDDGTAFPSKPASPGKPTGTAAFTAVADGPDIDFTIVLSKGPNNSFNPLGGDPNAPFGYSVDPLVRLDGAPNVRGDRYQGPSGPAVAPDADVFPTGVTISGTIPRAGVGTHTVTLTDLVLNINGEDPGSASGNSLSDPYGGFDTFYNRSADGYDTPQDWALSETVVVTQAAAADTVKPTVTITKPKGKKAKKAKSWTTVQGTISDALSGPDEVQVDLYAKTSDGWVYFNGKKYKDAKNKKQAVKKAKTLVGDAALNGKWLVTPGVKPPVGKLHVKAVGVDKDGNKKTKKITQVIKK